MGCIFSQMEVECLALKDLSSPRKSFTMDLEEEEDGRHSEQKVRWPCVRCSFDVIRGIQSTGPS